MSAVLLKWELDLLAGPGGHGLQQLLGKRGHRREGGPRRMPAGGAGGHILLFVMLLELVEVSRHRKCVPLLPPVF